tara:strand:- start:71393 stop:72766 length:1374 start_codon:yes stop_codon:yes gene_type:complete
MLNKDKDYHSYSSLYKFIEEGPSSLITERKISSTGLNTGKGLDDFMYNNFDDKYYVSDVNIKLTSMENKFIESILVETEGMLNEESLNKDAFVDICKEIIEENNYFATDRKSKSTSDEKIQERIDNVKVILLDRLKAGNKQIITPSLYIDINDMANKLKQDKIVSIYFDNSKMEEYQNLNQITLVFEFKNIKFKGVVDNIHIDHRSKTIQVNDLKFTSMSNKEFIKSFFKYRYDIQGCIYTLGLQHYIEENLELQDYTILEPSFIIVNKQEKPMLYRLKCSDLYSTFYGFRNAFGRTVDGIVQIVEDIQYHIENDRFEFSREYYSHGYESLNLNRSGSGDRFRFIRPLYEKKAIKLIQEEVEDNNVDILEEVEQALGVSKAVGLSAFDKYVNSTEKKSNERVKRQIEEMQKNEQLLKQRQGLVKAKESPNMENKYPEGMISKTTTFPIDDSSDSKVW